MPPLDHEGFKRTPHQESSFNETTMHIGWRMSALMGASSFDQRRNMKGLRAAFALNKTYKTPAVMYQTDQVDGPFKIQAWLEEKPMEGKPRLYTQVVEELTLPVSGDVHLIPIGEPQLRVTATPHDGGFGGYDFDFNGLDPQMLSAEDYDTLLTNVGDTVELIANNYYSSVAAAKAQA